MGFDFINHEFNLPTLMIQDDEIFGWYRLWIEQGCHQAIHLANFSKPLVCDTVRDDPHPDRFG
jgi:hypothetical protein